MATEICPKIYISTAGVIVFLVQRLKFSLHSILDVAVVVAVQKAGHVIASFIVTILLIKFTFKLNLKVHFVTRIEYYTKTLSVAGFLTANLQVNGTS